MILKDKFDLEVFTHSDTAKAKKIDNTPEEIHEQNLKTLYDELLKPLKVRLNVKYAKEIELQINSGYRSKFLNAKIGGVNTSQHSLGEAVDTVAIGITIEDFYQAIKELVKSKALEVDQCIQEDNRWVHLSYRKGKNRNQFLRAKPVNGKMQYKAD